MLLSNTVFFMAKSDKQEKIDFIVLQLEKGKTRGKILAEFVKKWQISIRTFDRFLKSADIKLRDRQKKASEAADAAYIKAKEEAAKNAVMSKQERLEYLTKIVKGEIEVPYSETKWDAVQKKFVIIKFVELPNHTARISAITEMNKMEGDHAPAKVAQTDKDGNDVKQVIIINGKEIEF